MNITLNLPDDLAAHLLADGLLTDAAITHLLTDALTLRASSANLRASPYYTLFDQRHDAVSMLSLDGRIMHINLRAVQMTGYSVDEMVGMRITDLSAEPEESSDVLSRVINGEKIAPYERRILTKSGEIFPAEITIELVRGSPDVPWYIQLIMRDITARKQAEKQLQDSEALLRQIIDLAPIHIFAKNAEGRYLLANQAIAQAYGTTAAAMIGKSDADLTRWPDEAARFQAEDRQVIETGQPLLIPECEFTDSEARKRVLRKSKIPLQFTDCSSSLAVLGVSTDITSIKQAEAELRQAYRQAYELAVERQHVKILTQFIQDSSHEFRTPLSVISTSIYLMTRTDDQNKRAAHVAQANTQIARITHLLDQLQTMAELDSNIPLDYSLIDVNTLLGEIADERAHDVQQRGLMIETAFANPLPQVSADGERLRQAFAHILDNAVRFTGEGGLISIQTRCDDRQVFIEFHDTGVGIPGELFAHAMRRFWRQDQAHTTPGFGLGLPIVQKIVDRHGGKLTLQSRDEGGTSVTIALPAIT